MIHVSHIVVISWLHAVKRYEDITYNTRRSDRGNMAHSYVTMPIAAQYDFSVAYNEYIPYYTIHSCVYDIRQRASGSASTYPVHGAWLFC